MRRALLAITILVIVAACGGGGMGGGAPQNVPVAQSLDTNAKLTIVVPNKQPGSASSRRPAFISPGTQSVGITVQTVNGVAPSPAPAATIIAISSSNPNCTTTATGLSCTASVTVPKATAVVLAIASYASTDGSGTPIGVGLTAAVNTTLSGSTFAVALGGVPATIVVSPTNLQANQNGTTQTFAFTVSAMDATGATIIPPSAYATPITLSVSGDPNSALGLSPTSIASPVNGGATVSITYTSAKALPGAATINATAGSATGHLTFTPLGSGGGGFTAGYRIFEYSIPTANSSPYGITVGPNDGALWFAENATNNVGKLFPSSCTTTGTPSCVMLEGALPQPINPTGITAGPDGNVWVGGNSTSGSVTNHLMVVEPNGNCAAQNNANLSGCTIFAGQIDPVTPALITDIRTGSDNLIHATMVAGGRASIEGYFPVTLPAAEYGDFDSSFTAPFAISTTQWFTDPGTNSIGLQICTEGCGSQRFSFVGGGNPQGIVSGPDGNIYVADAGNNAIVAFNPTTCSPPSPTCMLSYTIPTTSSSPEFLTVGADGNIWFTEYAASKIGVLVLSSHTFHEFALSANTGPWGIALGPDGNVWFTERTAGKIGVVMP